MKSRTKNLVRLLLAATTIAAATTLGLAQVPEHAPGSICVTPQFWCWAQVPGVVGTQCACPTVSGSVLGVYS